MQYLIYKGFSTMATPVKACDNEDEVEIFIRNEAAAFNDGHWRYQHHDGKDYYIIGDLAYTAVGIPNEPLDNFCNSLEDLLKTF